MVHNYIWTIYKWRLAKNASCLQHGESAHENLKYAHLIPYIIWIKIRTPNQPQICWLQLSISFGGNHFEPQPYQISRLFIKLRLCSCYSWKYHLPHLTETSLLRKGHGTTELQSWRLHDQLNFNNHLRGVTLADLATGKACNFIPSPLMFPSKTWLWKINMFPWFVFAPTRFATIVFDDHLLWLGMALSTSTFLFPS